MSLGRLDPGELALLDVRGTLISGRAPTKEVALHTAFYDTRTTAGAVAHLHSAHSVALSMLPQTDPDNVLPPLTPYGIMRLGKVRLLPVFLPGDPAMGEAVRGLAGKRAAVLLANHGPVVAGKDIEAAVNAIEELEETAHLAPERTILIEPICRAAMPDYALPTLDAGLRAIDAVAAPKQ